MCRTLLFILRCFWFGYAFCFSRYGSNITSQAAPAPMHYPGQSNVQFYVSQPAAEPLVVHFDQGAPAAHGQGGGNNVRAHHASRAQQNPIQIVPQTPSANQQLYCRELDGTYTLQTVNKIRQDLQPGYWKESSSGFPYWVRTANA